MITRASTPTTRILRCGTAAVLLAAAAGLSSCQQAPADRRSEAAQLTTQIRQMPGVSSAASNVSDNVATGRVHAWISVHVAQDITADQLAALTTAYADGLRRVDYTGYDTELVVHQGANRFVIDTGRQPTTAPDQLAARARDWVDLRHDFPSAAVSLRTGDPGQPGIGTIGLSDPADYTAVTAAVTTLATRFPQLAGGSWTIDAGPAHVASISTARRLPTAAELAVWTALNADQSIPHFDAMSVNAPQTPPLWISEQTLAREQEAVTAIADRHLPIVAALPAPVLYTASDQLQGHRAYDGHAAGPIAVTVGGCTARDYPPAPAEQALIATYETCSRTAALTPH